MQPSIALSLYRIAQETIPKSLATGKPTTYRYRTCFAILLWTTLRASLHSNMICHPAGDQLAIFCLLLASLCRNCSDGPSIGKLEGRVVHESGLNCPPLLPDGGETMHLQTSGMFYIIFVIAKQRLAQILRNAISLRWRAGIFNLDTGLRDVTFPFRAWLQPTAMRRHR